MRQNTQKKSFRRLKKENKGSRIRSFAKTPHHKRPSRSKQYHEKQYHNNRYRSAKLPGEGEVSQERQEPRVVTISDNINGKVEDAIREHVTQNRPFVITYRLSSKKRPRSTKEESPQEEETNAPEVTVAFEEPPSGPFLRDITQVKLRGGVDKHVRLSYDKRPFDFWSVVGRKHPDGRKALQLKPGFQSELQRVSEVKPNDMETALVDTVQVQEPHSSLVTHTFTLLKDKVIDTKQLVETLSTLEGFLSLIQKSYSSDGHIPNSKATTLVSTNLA